jgi:HEPN domain-containing protein
MKAHIPTWKEGEAIKRIVDGLNIALEEEGIEPSHSERLNQKGIDSIKLHKLIYLAIDEFGLDLTYSWFKYGTKPAYVTVGPDYVGPKASREVASPEEAGVGVGTQSDYSEGKFYSPEEYSYFFSNDIDLESILGSITKDYTHEFYSGYAPDSYEEVYVRSAIFQQSIDELEHSDLEEFNRDIEDWAMEVREEAQDLELAILSNEYIDEEAKDSLIDYTETFCIVADTVIQKGEVDEQQYEILSTLRDFYYSHSWKHVALDISLDTLKGPNAEKIAESSSREFDILSLDHESEFGSLKIQLDELKLLTETLDKEELSNSGGVIQDLKRDMETRNYEERNYSAHFIK